MSDERFIEIPWDDLEADTLHRLLEEFATRDGTDYGDVEVETEVKVNQLLSGLKRKHWLIIFDQTLQNTHIVDAREWRRAQASGEIPFD